MNYIYNNNGVLNKDDDYPI